MSLKIGQWVRCDRAEASRGTWVRYAGRLGRIVTWNRAAGEYGVTFSAQPDMPERVDAWFRPSELQPTETRPRARRTVGTARSALDRPWGRYPRLWGR